MNRDDLRRAMAEAPPTEAVDDGPTEEELDDLGMAEGDLAYAVDVTGVLERKRAAMAAHRSQIGPESFFLQLPGDGFRRTFGTEWFAVRGRTGTGGPTLVDLLPGLEP